MDKYFLTIDNGGTNTKAIVFDENGRQLGVFAFPTMRIEETSGFHEINLHDLWDSICDAIKKAISNADINPEQIAGISCVGHGKGLYMLDKNKQIFANGILSTDSRAVDLATGFENNVDKIFSISRQHVLPSQSPVLLNWMKNNKPDVYSNIGYVLSAKDFVRTKLIGDIFQEFGDASGNNILNLETQKYDLKLFEFFGITEMYDKMPPLKKYDELCGYVSVEAASQTGLKAGIPVFGGMFDIDACSVGTGVLNEDYFSVIVGTWNINVFASNKSANKDSGLMNSIYPTGANLVEASSATSAGNLEMTLQSLMSEEIKNANENHKSIYDILEDFLNHTDAKFSRVIFFPFLYGSNVNPDAEGAYIGIQSSTTKSAMVRAVYEGIVFAHRYHIEQLVKVLDHKPKAIRLSGGGTNSKAWVQMFSDILNIPIQLVEATEIGGLGGAIGSAVGSSVYPNIETAIKKMVHLRSETLPNSKQSAIYDQKYQMYLKLLNSLDNSWRDLKTMQEGLEQE
ncbi:FGGY-family carbohydrate kinase [Paucilactobacillus nenjiangensis]|uniref:FGGY-family carbohydrate kinase n=1 Tax=Paucilactobacillus nenjiangensis TaxID=1296540 RepID=UPI0010F4A84D|nr:FGGY-family carbohydrate kinase [Paucilactobacillus nenjiangensis]